MKNVIFSLFAIALAGVAAIAATTAMLNTPVYRVGPATTVQTAQATADESPAPASGSQTTRKMDFPDADRPVPGRAPKPAEAPPAASKPAAEPAKPVATAPDDEKEDKDPYEGIAPEDLPPDLQYDADATVSFPTNT